MMRQRLKNDWVSCIVNDIIKLMKNGSSAKQFNEKIGLPITRIETISNEIIDLDRVKYIKEHDQKLIDKHGIQYGDILLSHINSDTHLGKTAIYKNQSKQLIHGINLLLLRPSKEVCSDFINYQFKFLRIKGKFIDEAQRAVNQSSINQRKLKGFPMLLAPIPEQRAIVAKIEELFSELDNGIANLKKAKDKLEIYRQAVLKKAFEGELTREWREKQINLPSADELLEQIKEERQEYYEKQLLEWEKAVEEWEANGKEGKKPSKPKKIKNLPPFTEIELTKLDKLPSEWKWVKVDAIQGHGQYSIKAGPFGSSLKKSCYVEDGYKVYGQEQVIAGDWKIGDYYIDENKYKELKTCSVKPKDVLISLVGTVGKVLVLPNEVKPGVINPRLIKISLEDGFYLPEFFKYYFESSYLKSIYSTKSHGATMDIINLGIIRELPFPFLSKQEQTQIVQEIENRLSVCDNILANIEEGLEKAEALRQSILKKAFEGRLLSEEELEACRKESDWEPAEELLKRIKQERNEEV